MRMGLLIKVHLNFYNILNINKRHVLSLNNYLIGLSNKFAMIEFLKKIFYR